jgi:hypothetical protein
MKTELPEPPSATGNLVDSVGITDLAGKYLTFFLGGETYGIPVLKVREIISMLPITFILIATLRARRRKVGWRRRSLVAAPFGDAPRSSPCHPPFYFYARTMPVFQQAARGKGKSAVTACISAVLLFLAMAHPAKGTTYQVGPTRSYQDVKTVSPLLLPGDVVEVDGDTTYPGGVTFANNGEPDNPIIIRGIRVNGNRPVFAGVSDAPVLPAAIVRFWGSHYVMEGFDITSAGDPKAVRGFYNVADDITLRDSVVHDCPFTGISGSDCSGSLRLEYVEVHHCGAGSTMHQIYVGSNNTVYPNAVFHMEFCYIHDGTGGNNIKSRVGRTEIYYNWIEGASYHELDLDGADPKAQVPGTANMVREDAEIVGNVFVKLPSSNGHVANIGGDSCGWSNGRYRFVNNTVVLPSNNVGSVSVFQLKNAVQTFEVYNNLFYRYRGGPVNLLGTVDWYSSVPCQIMGSNNWVPLKSTFNAATLTNTLTGTDPMIRDTNGFDFTPWAGGVLADAGTASTPSPAGLDFPSPLPAPLFVPAIRSVYAVDSAVPRQIHGPIDIGAYGAVIPSPDYMPPVAVTQTTTITQSGALTLSPLDRDTSSGGIPLSILSVGPDYFGTVTISGSNLIYIPGSNFPGYDSFTYILCDGYGITTGTQIITSSTQESGSSAECITTAVALMNDCPLNPPGTKFAEFGNPAMNNQGHTAFWAMLAPVSSSSGLNKSNRVGIWADVGSSRQVLIARTNDVAQGTAGATFATFSDPVYNNNDQIAFYGTLHAGTGDAVNTNASGIWSNAPSGFLRLVARKGQQAPGCPPGTTFSAFQSLMLPDQGGVVFLATIQSITSPFLITSANNQGLWAEDTGCNLRLITQKGTLHPLTNKPIITLYFLPSASYVYGQSRGFNQGTGDLVYKAVFSDKSSGIFMVTFP